jgi:RHS repeat-associated protein
VYLAYADDQGLAGGTSAPELVHYGRPLRLQFDADGDGRVDMFDWYAMQTCFTKNTTRCNYLFDDNGDGVVNFYDLTDFKTAADGPQGGPGATQWRRKLVASRYGNPFMWTGQRYDATTGQYHFWARTYSPSLGRWMQRDPPTIDADRIGSLDEFIEEFQRRYTQNAHLSLWGFAWYYAGALDHRYIYSDTHGWIDMQHFLASAYFQALLGRAGASLLGWLKELLDVGSDSFFASEDLVSNRLGREFRRWWERYFVGRMNELTGRPFQMRDAWFFVMLRYWLASGRLNPSPRYPYDVPYEPPVWRRRRLVWPPPDHLTVVLPDGREINRCF